MPAARINPSVSDLGDIRAEQIRLVFTHATPALLGGLAVACVTVAVLWDVTPSSWLFAWSGYIGVITVARLAFVRLFLNLQLPDEALESWLRVYVAGTVLGGIAWGALGLMFSITPSLPHQVFTFLVLAGMCVGALSSHLALLRVYLAFLIPSLLPLMGWQLSRGDQINLGTAAVTALFGTVLIVIARGHHRSVSSSLEMRRENLSLVDTLGARNRELLRSNESRDVLRRLLELGLENTPIGTRLETALDIICSVTWTHFNSKAAILLADGSGQTLELTASRQYSQQEQQRSARIPIDSKRGGETGSTREVPLVPRMGGAGNSLHQDACAHTCYEVPICSGGALLGAMIVYLDDRHVEKCDEAEVEFLQATAATLAGIIERDRAEDEMKLAASVFDNSLQGIIITDEQAHIVQVNPAFTRITGYTQAQAVGQTPQLLRSGHHDKAFYEAMWNSINETGVWQGEIWNRRNSGEIFPIWQTIASVHDAQNKTNRYIGIFDDISEKKRNEDHMRNLAYYDALTGLPNRHLFEDRLQHAMEWARRNHTRLSVLFLDLHRFKAINNSFGYPAGDQVLQAAARRIGEVLRASDTAARIGGDEFGILLSHISGPHDAENVARKILGLLESPIKLDEQDIIPTATLGIGIYPEDGHDLTTLLKNVDVALDQAEQRSQRHYEFYSADMAQGATERVVLENALRHAIQHGELTLHFQPQFSLKNGLVTGMEALVRWHHPKLGSVSPAQFIPLAEQTGLITPLSDWVLQHAVGTWSELAARFEHVPCLCVNISGHHFSDPDLVSRLADVLGASAIRPHQLELEMTETALVADATAAAAILENLKGLGIRIAIDDFGTGYSSLNYLARFPIDTVKIDRSFVQKLTSDTGDASLIRAILQMCHALDLTVVAEGVESVAQHAMLREMSCDAVQGFLTGRPMPAEEVWRLLERRGPREARIARSA